MATSSALRILESIARRFEEQREDHDAAARTQLAFVHALIDEVRRRASDDAHVGALIAQLDDEVDRLARLANDEPRPPPPSGIRLRP